MPTIYGKKYTKNELLQLVGDISQIGGARHMKLVGGTHEGVDVVEFRTGSGFCFLAVPGRGIDITTAGYQGKALDWRSASGEVSPALYEEHDLGWLRSFPGGLVTTCGLTQAGAPCEDQGEKLGIHGRYSNTPASNVQVDGAWDGDDYKMWVTGKVRQSRLFGENLLMQRKVSAVLGESRFFIHDVVTNEGPRTVPHMILYHINGGFPVVDVGSQFVAPVIDFKPRDADAEVDKEHYYFNEHPTPGFKERCYYHEMGTDQDGYVMAALINKDMPDGTHFGFYVKYKKNELPKFTQWKMNGNQEYVVGMEPANCWVEGRCKERERGTLQFLEPGETREYHLEIGVLSGRDDVVEFEARVEGMKQGTM